MNRRNMICGLWALAMVATGGATVVLWLLHFISPAFNSSLETVSSLAAVSVAGYILARIRRIEHALGYHTHDGRDGIREREPSEDELRLRRLERIRDTAQEEWDGTR